MKRINKIFKGRVSTPKHFIEENNYSINNRTFSSFKKYVQRSIHGMALFRFVILYVFDQIKKSFVSRNCLVSCFKSKQILFCDENHIK